MSRLALWKVVSLVVFLAVGMTLGACDGTGDGGASGAAGSIEIPELPAADLDPAVLGQLRGQREEVLRLVRAGAPAAERAAAVGELARLFHAYGFAAEAEASYELARGLAPDELRWPYLLGQLLLTEGQPDRALDPLRDALAKKPDDVPAAMGLARALQAAGRPADAVPILDGILARKPTEAAVLFQRGQIAVEQGKVEEGVAYFERARASQPAAGPVRTALAAAYNRLGRRPEAEDVLRARAEQPIAFEDPLLAEISVLASGGSALLDRGVNAFRQGQFAAAEADFRRAVAAQPEDPDAHLNLGSALVQLGRVDEARKEYDEAIRLAPDKARARFNLGTLLASQSDDSGALAELEQALKTDPGYWEASYNAGNAALRLGRFEDCVRHFGAAIAAQPALAGARYGEGVCLAKLGRDADARAHLEQALQVVKGDRGVTLALARLLAASPNSAVRDGARAKELALQLGRTGNDQMTIETLAMASAETGDFAGAVVWQERALQVARAAGRLAGTPAIEKALAGYRKGEPWRAPFRGDELRAKW